MDLMTVVFVWCGIHFNSVSICQSGPIPLCGVSVDVGNTTICYWVILTEQNVTSSEAKCKLDNGTLAYIPNEDALLKASAFVTQQLGTGAFVYTGYTRTIQAFMKIRGTGIEQTWVAWDAAFSQPNNGGECVVIFTYTGKFHDILCTGKFYALCSTTFNSIDVTTDFTTDVITDVITDVTTDVTSDVTTDVTKDVTSYITTDVTTDVTVSSKDSTNSTACHCDCDTKRSRAIYPTVNITEELQVKLDTLKKKTKVDEAMLSSTIRTKTSASDHRPSSAYVGYLGIALLTMIFGGIVLVDLSGLITTFKTC